jgi:hypothetical protein
LNEFFEKTKKGYINARADDEIKAYNVRVDINRKVGKLAHKKTDKVTSTVALSPPQQNRTDTEQNITTDANASMSETAFPPCPHKELLKLYQKHLPHLTQPRLWEGSRMTTMKSRWVQASRPSEYSPKGYNSLPDGLAWWDSFFGYIANDTSLAKGFETNGRTWQPDLVWIINPTNFAKIIDGKYSK